VVTWKKNQWLLLAGRKTKATINLCSSQCKPPKISTCGKEKEKQSTTWTNWKLHQGEVKKKKTTIYLCEGYFLGCPKTTFLAMHSNKKQKEQSPCEKTKTTIDRLLTKIKTETTITINMCGHCARQGGEVHEVIGHHAVHVMCGKYLSFNASIGRKFKW